MQWIKSKTVWSAIIIGLAHGLAAANVITAEQESIVEGIAFAVFGLGVRQAIAKNGEGK